MAGIDHVALPNRQADSGADGSGAAAAGWAGPVRHRVVDLQNLLGTTLGLRVVLRAKPPPPRRLELEEPD